MLLIITPSQFESNFFPLRGHKERTGILTTIITLDQVYRAYSGRDEAEKVKRCIADYFQQRGIRFVLLAGDSDTFPVRYTKTDRGDANAFNTAFYPTDLYYAALYKQDGSFDDWDRNGNGYYGELNGETHSGPINIDQVNLKPNVAVGRIPASSVGEINCYVQKIIRYELNAYGASWAKKALLMATHDWSSEACRVQERIARDYLGDYSRIILSSTGSPCSSAGSLNPAAVTNHFNSGTGLVGYIGHGGPEVLGLPEGWWGIDNISQLTNADHLPIMCVAGCDTAAFSTCPPYSPYTDISNANHIGTNSGERFSAPPPQPNCFQRWNDPDNDLATHLTVRNDTGVIAYLGGVTGMQFSEPLEYFFQSIQGSVYLGEAWQKMIGRYYEVQGLPGNLSAPNWVEVARMHQPWKFMLFGDPSLRIGGVVKKVWSRQQLTSVDRGTSTAPALAAYQDKLYMVWKGYGDDMRIFYSTFSDNHWSPQQLTSADRGTSTTPALAVYQDKLFMVWKGLGNDPRIFYSTFDGRAWSPQQLTSGDRGTSAAPALAAYRDRLYMVWKGLGSDTRIFYSTFDGRNWSPQQITAIDQWSSTAPALSTYGDQLVVVLKAIGNDPRIFYSTFDGRAWSPCRVTSTDGGTSTTPALATYRNKLYMIWKGLGDDPRLFQSTFDGRAWSPQQLTSSDRGTSVAPTLSAFRDKLFMTWKGVQNDVRLFFSFLQLDD